jgi:hypothetical protein
MNRARSWRRGGGVVLTVALGALLGNSMTACERDAFCIDCGDGAVAPVEDGGGIDGSRPDLGALDLGPPPCTDLGVELCNGLDDDCDGVVDNGFDLQTNPLHCGACDHACRLPNADVACVAGECQFRGCLEGFVTLPPGPPGDDGCEYRCPVFPPTDERCNGIDDDCDGLVDEAAELEVPPADLCRVVPGTPCADVRPICTTRGAVTGWFCAYPPTVEFDPSVPNGIVLEETKCDGSDGDCDGVADDSFPDLGRTCDDGRLGACRDEGVIACDPADPSRTRCDFSRGADPVPGAPMPETCNGVDDDCDGVVDDSDPSDPGRVRDEMVEIVRGTMRFWIYRYEASRPDATATSAGTREARACSKPGALPWTRVSFPAAQSACEAAGKRLCTGAEWRAACEGMARTPYPYGATYEPLTCNGADRDAIPGGAVDHAIAPTGALPMCRTSEGVWDMSGNVKEWTDDLRGTVDGRAIHVVRGGSYESPERGLTCETDLSRATVDTLLPTLGFRCCSNSPP